MSINKNFSGAARYLMGLDERLCDARPAQLAVGICRIAMFCSLLWLHIDVWSALSGDGNFAAWLATKSGSVYHPFGILRFFGSDAPPPESFWFVIKQLALVSTIFAIVGFITRPMMIISVVTNLLLALLLISESYFWSHSWNVVFLAAIPFALCNAGSFLSVDRAINSVLPWHPFGQRSEPVLWGVLAAQASVALFVFAAFFAKIFESFAQQGLMGPYHYVFSDNMRNILGIFWLGTPENVAPPWIEWAWSIPAVWILLILGHVVMQAAPILAIGSLNKPWIRMIEGLIFMAGVIALGIFANGWNWAWIPLTAFFIDWDYFAGKYFKLNIGNEASEEKSNFPAMKLAPISVLLACFFGVYIFGWVTQSANSWGWYPFSNMSFYATFYVREPFDEHLPYADYHIGQTTILNRSGLGAEEIMPEHWRDVTNETWPRLNNSNSDSGYRVNEETIEFPYRGNEIHGLARETDLARIRGGLEHVATILLISNLPENAFIVSNRITSGFPPYPEPMRRYTLHSGVRGMLEPATGQFAGLMSLIDRDAGVITVAQIEGESGDARAREIYARFNAHLSGEVLELERVPGEWLDETTFIIEREWFLEKRGPDGARTGVFVNMIIRTQTIFGIVDFDGPAEWW